MSKSNQITIRQGETLQIPITVDDPSAESATFRAALDGTILIEESISLANGEGTFISDDTSTPGEYEWLVVVHYSDDVTEVLPDQNCDGDCELPVLKICEVNMQQAEVQD